jgi:hypothetical protein
MEHINTNIMNTNDITLYSLDLGTTRHWLGTGNKYLESCPLGNNQFLFRPTPLKSNNLEEGHQLFDLEKWEAFYFPFLDMENYHYATYNTGAFGRFWPTTTERWNNAVSLE